MGKHKFAAKAMQSPSGRGGTEFHEYYQSLFNDPSMTIMA